MNDADDEIRGRLREALESVEASPGLRRSTLERAATARKRRFGTAGVRPTSLRLTVQTAIVFAVVAALALLRTSDTPPASQQSASPTPEKVSAAAMNRAAMPEYIPAGYKVEEVVSIVPETDEAPEIQIHFTSEASGLMELRRRSVQKDEAMPDGYYSVTIKGNPGWIRRDGERGIRLIWKDGEYEYTLTGQLSEGEAKKIAGSIRIDKVPKEDARDNGE
ncbi:DUF4367 domain-containing protein [Cohnella panacarvi]|uniref:DUF4367 domain-containing protein n=1 Tax=Cohnella panacarvi TaxID=400776 RepID=UPI00047B55AC|nr:DUF4367 domain-containing protein [Cohnella panacarvi]